MQDYRMDTLIAVCKHMNFTRAAQELHLAQPTVSLHIHWLEQYYGAPFFRSQGKKLQLTEAGRLVLEAALTQQNDDRRLQKKISLGRQAPLRLGATQSVAEAMLCRPLSAFLKRRPRDFVQIDIDNTASLLQKLDRGALDAAFIEGAVPIRGFDAALYRREIYTAVCAPDFPGRGEWAALEDLFPAPLLLREEGSGTRGILERFLEERRHSLGDFSRIIEIGSIHLIKEMAKAGCGISFLYEAAVAPELTEGTLIRLPLPGCTFFHDIYFAWRRGSLYEEEYRDVLRDFQQPDGERPPVQ